MQNPRGNYLPGSAEGTIYYLSFLLFFFSVSIKEIKDLEEDRQTNRDTDRMLSKYVKAWKLTHITLRLGRILKIGGSKVVTQSLLDMSTETVLTTTTKMSVCSKIKFMKTIYTTKQGFQQKNMYL